MLGAEVEPYMTIRKQFEVLMDTMDVCIVIGFSFRDEHINDIFSKFLTLGKSIIIVSPSADKTTFAHFLMKDVSGTQYVMYHKTDRSIFSYFRENSRIITINQPLSADNSTTIAEMISDVIGALNLNPAAPSFDVWRNKSINGEVCAILGCKNSPNIQCSTCSVHYCSDHIGNHFHDVTGEVKNR
jgi:hypothetical protein